MANSRSLRLRIASAWGILTQRGHKMSPNERLKALEVWSARATLLILIGILVELWVLWHFPHEGAERVWLTLGNAAIAAGLIVEYLIIGRTISATDEANREAAWRTLSPRQKLALQNMSASQCLAVITTLAGDIESKYFAEQFREPLLKAGWDVSMSIVTTPADVGFGVQIPRGQGTSPLHSNAVDRLIGALESAGIDATKNGDLPSWAMETRRGGNSSIPFKACLFVGPKPPPA